MLRLVALRVLIACIALWGVTTVVFVLLRVLPGDPVSTILAGSGASQTAISQARAQMGLDDPLVVQYLRYLSNVARGDFGRSLFSNRPVTLTISEQLPATLELAGVGLFLTIAAGLGLGVTSALRAGSWFDRITMAGAALGVSVPLYWSGLLLAWLFSVTLAWLPATGAGGWRHLVMPAGLLGLVGSGPLARLVRSNMLTALRADYVTAAHGRGVPRPLVTRRHVLRNAIIPAVNLIGLQAGFLLGGTVVTETVFGRPGLGRVVVDAILWKDLPVVQACVLLISATYVVINLAVDLLTMALDPRLRRS